MKERGCRQWFGIDGCQLIGPYGGILLAVVAIDANKGQYYLQMLWLRLRLNVFHLGGFFFFLFYFEFVI